MDKSGSRSSMSPGPHTRLRLLRLPPTRTAWSNYNVKTLRQLADKAPYIHATGVAPTGKDETEIDGREGGRIAAIVALAAGPLLATKPWGVAAGARI